MPKQAWDLEDSSLPHPSGRKRSGGSPTRSYSTTESLLKYQGDPFVFKGLELQNDIQTTKEYSQLLKNGKKRKLETNTNTKELANHVK